MSRELPETWPLSPGAERVLVAADTPPGVVTGIRILHALWQDESRAAEVLRTAGFDAATLQQTTPTAESAPGDVLRPMLRVARRIAIQGGEGEIATEHLLAALLEVDPEIRRLLPDLGRSGLSIVRRRPTPDEEPLEFDEELNSAESRVQRPAVLTSSTSPLTNPTDTHRILDAAANRGREGLRVVEDYVRFRLNDAHLSRLLKSLRHDLTETLSRMGGDAWHRFRDTTGDVGTEVRTRQESLRESLDDVVRANCKRIEESLRSLEEYGKLINPGAASVLEELRYRFYTIEKAVLATASSRQRLTDSRLYLLLTEAGCPQGVERTVREALAGGVDMIQLREKNADDGHMLRLAKQLRDWTRETGALFIVNDRPDLAVLSDADGVHVGQDDLPCCEARRIVGAERMVGVSTHSIEQVRQAVLAGADYIGVGPVFASQTKQFDDLAGLDFVRQVAAEISLPWFAIGGIDQTNVADAIAAGASRVAVSRSVCGAADVRASAGALAVRLGPKNE